MQRLIHFWRWSTKDIFTYLNLNQQQQQQEEAAQEETGWDTTHHRKDRRGLEDRGTIGTCSYFALPYVFTLD